MRTDDPKRDSVVSTVAEQTVLVKEIVRVMLTDMRKLYKPQPGARITEILKRARINNADALAQRVKDHEAAKLMIATLSKSLRCEEEQVCEEVKRVVLALENEKKLSEKLKDELQREHFQLEILRKEVENLGHARTEAPSEAIPGTRRTASIHHGPISEGNWFQVSQPTTSMEFHHRSSRNMPIERSESNPGTGRSSDTGEPTAVEFSMGDYIRTMALPEVQPFSGKPNECFKRFLNSFEIKYPRGQWRDSSRVQLFQNFLRKSALTIFETLPKEVREGAFDDVVEAMKRRMRIDGNSERVRALAELRSLSIREGQPVSEFCLVLERLAYKAYPDVPQEVTSLQKAEILCRQLSNWNGSYCLAEALEVSSPNEAYETVKEVALRLERSLKTAEEYANAGSPRSTGRGVQRQQRFSKAKFPQGDIREERKPLRSTLDRDRATAEDRNTGKEQILHKGRRLEEGRRCYNCGAVGHLAKDCRVSSSQSRPTGTSKAKSGSGTEGYSSLVEKWTCAAGHDGTSTVSEFFGKKSLERIRILGMDAAALLDTGSQTTIVPLQLLKKAVKLNVNLDNYIERIPGPSVKIRDASGNEMKFLDTIRVAITLQGRLEFIAAYVGRGVDEVVILGTNALEIFNLGLQRIDMPTRSTHEQRRTGEGKVLARVKHRVFIPAGGIQNLTITCARATTGGSVLWSAHPQVSDGVCDPSKEGEVIIPVVNHTTEGVVFKKGQIVGEWENESWVKPKHIEPDRDMLDLKQPEKWKSREQRLAALLEKVQRNGQLPEEAVEIITAYNDVFAVTDAELTQTDLVVHDIDTGEHKPIKQKTRPVPLAARKEFKNIIKDLVDRGIIQKSSSEWASPVVLVKKKDGTLRLCIDYRELNKIIRQDSYPLPKIDTVLQCLKGKRFFSTMDLASGYWQIRLSEDAKRKSAFTTSEGLFEFTVLPFGLSTSPSVFQRMMDMVIKGLDLEDEVFVYIDDILIGTDTLERHYAVLKLVLEALRRANLRLKPQKCDFIQESVSFLGHYIDKEGVKTDKEKVRKIVEYPIPKNVAELRTFLGMASYYRKFIAGFSKMAKGLYNLISPKTKWTWTEEENKKFEALKTALVNAPVLAQPDISAAEKGDRPFIIYTDASGEGLGAVLCQEGDDKLLHPVFFASRGLSKAERNYHITDLEALAVMFALQKFHFFVYGLRTIVRTDHQPLTCLFKRTNVSARVLRWALEIQKYRLEIEYVAGKANAVADALSRSAVNLEGEDPTIPANDMVICEVKCEDSEWLKELRADEDFKQLIDDLEKHRDDKDVRLPRCSRKFRVADFLIDNGDLKMVLENTTVRVVPKSQRRAVFEEAHRGAMAGHLNGRKLNRRLRKVVFWEGMENDIVKWSKECSNCFLAKSREIQVPPLKPFTTHAPFELIGLDLVELGLTERGNRYALVVIDHFSKYAGAYPIPDKSARTVARTLFERWICEGCRWPKRIHSDQGPEFVNSVLSGICNITGIEQSVTKGYNPRENGMTERVIETFTKMLRKKTVIPADWDLLLPMVVFAYNSCPHDATGESPFYLLHAFDPNYPSKVIPQDKLSFNHFDVDDYKHELLAGIQLAQDCSRELNEKYKKRMKAAYDKRNNVDARKLPKTGDRVLLKLPRERANKNFPKLCEPWGGPYRVIETSDNSALISNINEKEEPIRIPFDALVVVPNEVEHVQLKSKTKRVKRRQAVSKSIYCRATVHGDGDTAPLGLFFCCPGKHEMRGSANYSFSCTVHDKRFKDVVQDAIETIGKIQFHSIYGLARLISIYEQEKNDERRRFLMLDPSYEFLTVSGAQKAFTFFKHCCDHVFRSLACHDGSVLSLPHDGGTGFPVEQLNDVNNEGVKYAKLHSWEDVAVATNPKKVLLILPDAFRTINSVFKARDDVEFSVYSKLSDVSATLQRTDARICVFIAPATDVTPPKKEWFRLASSLANAARNGMKIVAVAPPRGDDGYDQNRMETNEAIDLARKTASLMKQNLISLIPVIESVKEPSHGPAAHPRVSAADAYTAAVIKEYFNMLRDYIRAEVQLPELDTSSRTVRSRQYFKQRKEKKRAEEKVQGGRVVKQHRFNFRMTAPTPYAMLPQGIFTQWNPMMGMYPGQFGNTRARRGRGGSSRRPPHH
ncbi:hypothetical protein Y032_0080g1333 [Ancylostoma ceylanicum]|nr:hypothetical protein Y032_0080g1333 [Ancylostoma ceylanicum]